MMTDVQSHLDYVVRRADTLRFNLTNNQAERFNSLVAKMISGKRIDHGKRGGYRGRVFGAGLAHGGGPSWHLSPLRRLHGHSPGEVTKKELLRRRRKGQAAVRRRLDQGPSFKKKMTGEPDRDYGPLAAQEDLPDDELNTKCESILSAQREQLQNVEMQQDLQERTRVNIILIYFRI